VADEGRYLKSVLMLGRLIMTTTLWLSCFEVS